MQKGKDNIELTLLMPCKDEEQTVGICTGLARKYMRENGINGEVIVVDNASSDASARCARQRGARVIYEPRTGYGSAIRAGLRASKGEVIIIVDCDLTYDIREIGKIYEPLKYGPFDMMIGDRFLGNIEKGAMPISHYFGVRFLSLLGRWRFHTDVGDFHCGLRGLKRNAVKKLRFKTRGMEFATEFIAEAVRVGLSIGQTPVSLRRCRYDRKSKLRTIRDGMRHMKYIISG